MTESRDQNTIPTPATLREFLHYDPKTGDLFWRERASKWFSSDAQCSAFNTRFAGKRAFTHVGNKGLKRGMILGVVYQSARIAWAIYYGEHPPRDKQVIHKNQNYSDDSIKNLMLGDAQTKAFNRKVSTKNITGFKGVCYNKRDKRYIARLKRGGFQEHLGSFKKLEDAKKCYNDAFRTMQQNLKVSD